MFVLNIESSCLDLLKGKLIRVFCQGYTGIEGLFLSGLVLDEAYEDSGHSLDFYRSFNQSHNDAKKYFADVSELNLQDFGLCTELFWGNPEDINLYLEMTGDTDGVVALDSEGNYRAFCPDSVDGRMWIAPACRTNVSQCIPCITTSFGWGLHFLMQQLLGLQRISVPRVGLKTGTVRGIHGTCFEVQD